MADALDEIEEEAEDAQNYPTAEPGTLKTEWLDPRCVAKVILSGCYCHVTCSDTIAELHPKFVSHALKAGYDDFDAALLKNAQARDVTQAIAAHLYPQNGIDGIHFVSRHGDDLQLWCVFEQPNDPLVSPHLFRLEECDLDPDTPELQQAFAMLKLRWATGS